VKNVPLWQGCRDEVTDVGYGKKMPQNERNRNPCGITRILQKPPAMPLVIPPVEPRAWCIKKRKGLRASSLRCDPEGIQFKPNHGGFAENKCFKGNYIN